MSQDLESLRAQCLVAQQVKNPPANSGDAGQSGLNPGLGRSPGEANGNPLQYSCLGNFTDRGAWQATVHEITESDTAEYIHIRHDRTELDANSCFLNYPVCVITS